MRCRNESVIQPLNGLLSGFEVVFDFFDFRNHVSFFYEPLRGVAARQNEISFLWAFVYFVEE